jgi:integrase/recombinase XerC
MLVREVSMTDSFLRYLQFEKRVSPHTVLAYESDLAQFESFINGNFPGEEINEAGYGTIRAWIISLVEADVKAPSINRKIASLRAYYKFLLRQELITKDPLLKIKPLKTSKRLPTFVKEGDMVKILDQVGFENNLGGFRDKLIIELFYATGIRLSELIHLKESQVDLRSRTIKVLGKRNKERIIPFSTGIVSVIQEYQKMRNKEVDPGGHGFLLVTDSGEPCYPMMVYRIVRKYLDQYTSTEKRSPHVLRHTYATHLLNKGAEINAVKDLLGHTSLAATQVYTHNSLEKLKKVFDQAHPKA